MMTQIGLLFSHLRAPFTGDDPIPDSGLIHDLINLGGIWAPLNPIPYALHILLAFVITDR